VAIFSRIFLGEKCGLFSMFTIFLTLLGIVFIVKPPSIFGDELDEASEIKKSNYFLGPLAAILSAVFTSSAMILIRVLKELHHSVVICNFGLFAFLFTLLLLLTTGKFCLPSCPNRYLVLLLGTFSFLGQILLTISLKIEEAGVISIARSTTIVFAFIWQIIFFNQIPCFTSVLGAILIIGSVGLNALKKYAIMSDNVPKNLARLLKL
jgi:drug/metabolite transporter (DMT)-like permease